MATALGIGPSQDRRKKKKYGPGVGSKLLYGLSLLERPAQALKVGIREAADEDEEGFLEGAKKGWLGEEEVRGQEVLFDKEYMEKHPIMAGIGGFLFDVATDPLTYLGGYVFKAAGVGAKAGFGALPAGAQGAMSTAAKTMRDSKYVEGMARGLNIPYGKARQVKTYSLEHLNKLQMAKNESDEMINAYQKFAKKRARELGLKGKEGQEKIHSAFRNYIEQGGHKANPMWQANKGKYIDLGTDGYKMADRHAQRYEDMLTLERGRKIRVGEVGRQIDIFDPIYGYFPHIATKAARREYGSDITEFMTSQGFMKARFQPGITDDINERMWTAMGEENMFHTNPAIAMGVRSRQHAAAMEASWFKEEITNPLRGMGLWFRRNPNNLTQMQVRGKRNGLWKTLDPTDPEDAKIISGYQDTKLDSFKQYKWKEETLPDGTIQEVPSKEVLSTFKMPRDVANMVKERHELMVGGKKQGDFLQFYDDVQNGWKRWTLSIRPAYHTRNMVGNYLNAFMLSGVTNARRFWDAGGLQKKALQGKLDDTVDFVGSGTKDDYGPFTEQKIYDEINQRGGIGGLYSQEIMRTAEEEIEATLKYGNPAIRLLRGDVAAVKGAFFAGSQLENNARIGVFLDTLAKARKNPSKFKWYDPDSGRVMKLSDAKNFAISRRTGDLRRLTKYEKQLKNNRGPDGLPLLPEERASILNRQNKILNRVEAEWKTKVDPLGKADKTPETKVMLQGLAKHDAEKALFDVAGFEMKKSLFDYSDLSKFERNFMKRVIPFYTWSRKNIPAQLQGLVKNPQRAEKLQIAREQFEHQGGSPEDRDVGPMWSGTVPIFLGKENEGVRSFFSLLNYAPIADLERIANPQEILKQMVSPLAKEPLEQISNYDFFRERKMREYKGQSKDFLGVSMPPRAWHALQLLVPLVELNRLNPANVFGLQRPGETGDLEVTKGWYGLGALRESNPVDIPGLARTIRFFAGVRRYDLDLQKSRDWNKKKFVRDLNTLKGRLKWAKKKGQRRKAEELMALIDAVISGEVTNPLLNQ